MIAACDGLLVVVVLGYLREVGDLCCPLEIGVFLVLWLELRCGPRQADLVPSLWLELVYLGYLYNTEG